MLRDRKKVVWYEGMTLDPHHFQQWDRYQHATLNARLRALVPNDWGLTDLRVDRERLANGEFALTRCAGITSDGVLFQMPEHDDLPAPRPVQDAFGATRDRLGVFLALPAERSANVRLQGSERRQETRWSAASISVPDDNTGADERSIEVANGAWQIRLEGEPLDAFTTIQVASVMRNASGALTLDEQFIPPSLSLEASDRIPTIARRLLELLVARSLSLAERHQNATRQRELSPADIMALGLLATVNTYIPLLNHHLTQGKDHPVALYQTLLALAGALTAQLPGSTAHPRSFPVYDHGDLTRCFGEMDAMLRGMLGEAQPRSNYLRVVLQKQRENLYTGTIDQAAIETSQLFLVARGDGMKEERLITELPRMLRIASPSTIEDVLRSYTRALTVEHTHRLPVGMPVDQQAN
ncbi:MAG TPA: type VI secretion system baseplate subunit TssK, partial [Rhodothermales bacterium]